VAQALKPALGVAEEIIQLIGAIHGL